VYAFRTHESWAAETPEKVFWMLGKATNNTVASKDAAKTAKLVKAKIFQALDRLFVL
jgi:hypothetical protein